MIDKILLFIIIVFSLFGNITALVYRTRVLGSTKCSKECQKELNGGKKLTDDDGNVTYVADGVFVTLIIFLILTLLAGGYLMMSSKRALGSRM